MIHCLVDNSNIINISYANFVKILHDKNGDDYVISKDDLGLFWHLYVHKIKDFITTYKDVIFCGEGFNSTKWRKEIYPLYKENRGARKENPDYAFIGECYKNVDKYINLLGFVSLRTENCEADDEIYKLAEYFTSKGDQVMIISSDKDLTQIATFFDGVSLVNPITKKNVEINENILLEKALVGDASDNIKGIPRVGKKTLEKMLADKAEWNKKMTPENVDLFDTIMKIVDLRKYPKEFQDAIIEKYENYPKKELDINGVEAFYLEYGLVQCRNEWAQLSSEILMTQKSDSTESLEDEMADILNEINS